MRLDLTRRVDLEEHLDSEDVDRETMIRSLGQVSQVNRWLGGDRGLREGVRDLAGGTEPLSLLDLGAGDGTSLLRLAAWMERREGRRPEGGAPPRVTGTAVDLHPVACAVAGRNLSRVPGMEVLRGDALHLPFSDGAFDVAFSALTLHHFDDDQAVRVLEEMARVARRRIVVSDLERSPGSYLGARLLAATLWRGNRYTRHDGPISVRRGFRAEELETLGRRAGLRSPRVHRTLPFRLTLLAEPPEPRP